MIFKTDNTGTSFTTSYVEVKEENIFVFGLAYFRGDRIVGTTDPLEIAIVMELLGVEQGGYAVLKPVPGKQGAFMAEASHWKTKIRVNIRNGKPHVLAKTHIEAKSGGKIQRTISDQHTGGAFLWVAYWAMQ